MRNGWNFIGIENGENVPRFELAHNQQEAQIRVEFMSKLRHDACTHTGTCYL